MSAGESVSARSRRQGGPQRPWHHDHRRATNQDSKSTSVFRSPTRSQGCLASNAFRSWAGRLCVVLALASVLATPASLQIYVVDVEGGKAMLVVSPTGE